MGVDRAGNLWTWRASQRQARLWSKDGSIFTVHLDVTEDARLDADFRWGIAAISEQGKRLQLFDWQGRQSFEAAVPNTLGDITWIAETLVAVTTKTAGHQVELWDLGKGVATDLLGQEKEIRPTFGAQRLRFARIHYAPKSKQLYTFDTFTGAIQAFTLQGERAWNATVDNPRAAYYKQWLAEMDKEAKAAGEIRTPTFVYWDSFQVDEHGAVWVLERCDYETQEGHFLRLNTEGTENRKSRFSPCCAPEFVLWQDKLIAYREPNSPRPACTGLGEAP